MRKDSLIEEDPLLFKFGGSPKGKNLLRWFVRSVEAEKIR